MNQQEGRDILNGVAEGASGCDKHPCEIPDLTGAVVLCAYYDDEHGWGPEHDAAAVARLADGRFVVIWDSEDSSGHG